MNRNLENPLCYPTHENQNGHFVLDGGMTLLDHFAGLAMNGILSGQVDKQGNGRLTDEAEANSISKESYLIADAMLKARKEVYGE